MKKKALDFAQGLIRCKSVTPAEGGALTFVEEALGAAGFEAHRMAFSEEGTPDVENLFIRWGSGGPHFCFAGHVDVVPPGSEAAWSFDPFCGDVADGVLRGRGTTDMKGAIGAFMAAALHYIETEKPQGSISLLLTADEEGPRHNGTKKVLPWMEAHGHIPDFCIVGEPTSDKVFGDTIKIGRRGSLYGYLAVPGLQGHVAYQDLADNPVPRLLTLLQAVEALHLDDGTEHFQPSNLEITILDTGTGSRNTIPGTAKAVFSVRYNSLHTSVTLEKLLRETLDACGHEYILDINADGGDSFYTPPGELSNMVASAIRDVTGTLPVFSTTGGTSDAGFIRNYCPVVEFGVRNALAHKVDERLPVADLHALADIYAGVLARFFKG